jgi:serine/threonine protein kinase
MERFANEIRVLAELNHPNIVMAHEAGEVPAAGPRNPALLYLAMELVQGNDLEQEVMAKGRADIPTGCEWIRQAALGIQAAHDRHVIHRDLKPSNMLLSSDGQVKVVDFGLVKDFSGNLTNPHALLGTVEFMAPEQSRDPTKVSAQADIYGLGASLFWLLAGEPPYPHVDSMAAAVKALQQNMPRRLRSVRPDVPESLDAFVAAMLHPDPARRPAKPATIANTLAAFVEGNCS